MVIMATDMALKNKVKILFFIYSVIQTNAWAGDWTFSPAISTEETYSDNLSLSTADEVNSFVNKTSIALKGNYDSKNAKLNLLSLHSFHSYSHDSELNDNTRSSHMNGSLALWNSGFTLNSSASIQNINRNESDNALDELVTERTVESIDYSLGVNYKTSNTSMNFNSDLTFVLREVDDNIGESEGYNFSFSTSNGSGARNIFWQSTGRYADREDASFTGQNYSYEIKIGWISPYKLTPFLRYYEEDSSGNIGSEENTTTTSWGPGLRWQVTPHIIFDASYNYVTDGSATGNYIDSTIKWQPSQRTSLDAGYSKRFFGDSYNVQFKHRNKRLTNTIKYEETLSAFNRNTYVEDESGDLILDDDNGFDLSKSLNWTSSLQLARTNFSLSITNYDNESLETNSKNETFTSNVRAERTLSRNSSLSATFLYENKDFNKGSTTGSEQTDYYRTYSISYERSLLHSVSTSFKIQFTDRSSTDTERSYTEARAAVNLSKEF